MATIAQDHEKVLSRFDLTAIAVGNVIGGGIMSVVGIAIGLTGRSVAIALMLSSVMTLISILPKAFASATVRMNGGEYTLLPCSEARCLQAFTWLSGLPTFWSFAVLYILCPLFQLLFCHGQPDCCGHGAPDRNIPA